MGQLFSTTKSCFERSRDLHFVRLSRKPSNLCALLRSHEAMIDCVLMNCIGDVFQKTLQVVVPECVRTRATYLCLLGSSH